MLTVVYCTRESNPAHKEHIIKSSGLHKHIEVIEIINNGESLTKAYNRGLKQASFNHVVFCHDDIIIETKQWGHKLLKQFNKNPDYGILGVAGTKFMSASGQWWENNKKMYGRVSHTHEGKTWLSSYSPDLGHDIEETIIVDGVFFAVDKSKLKADFNESVEGFHFYDITFCFENYLKGVKIGVVTTVRINHKSIGMTNASWEANRVQFATTFKDNLPVEIKKVLRKGEKFKVLVGCFTFKGETDEEKYNLNLIKELTDQNCEVSLVSVVDAKFNSYLKNLGVKVYSLQEPPGFKLGDGKWVLNGQQGQVVSQPNTLYKLLDINFDKLYLSTKPVVDHLLRLYPNTETICTIHSEDRAKDEPVKNPQIVKYIAVSDYIKDVLIEGYQIDSSLIELAKPINEPVPQIKLRRGPIKIVSGWTNKGGSTNAFIALTNALNKAGHNATFYGPHTWHLDKCKSGILNDKFTVGPYDRMITHFLKYPTRPAAGKVILSCHEKDLFQVGQIEKYWDSVVFLNERHREYHSDYQDKFTIIPNLKMPFIKKDKTGLEKIAGVIGSFDENKQTHVSIQRALADGCEMIYLFGQPEGPYYETYVKPLLSDKVIIKGFVEDKQTMYDSIGCVYHSSKSEVACLVKDECESTGTKFNGNEATDNPPVLLTNKEIIAKWVELLEL